MPACSPLPRYGLDFSLASIYCTSHSLVQRHPRALPQVRYHLRAARRYRPRRQRLRCRPGPQRSPRRFSSTPSGELGASPPDPRYPPRRPLRAAAPAQTRATRPHVALPIHCLRTSPPSIGPVLGPPCTRPTRACASPSPPSTCTFHSTTPKTPPAAPSPSAFRFIFVLEKTAVRRESRRRDAEPFPVRRGAWIRPPGGVETARARVAGGRYPGKGRRGVVAPGKGAGIRTDVDWRCGEQGTAMFRGVTRWRSDPSRAMMLPCRAGETDDAPIRGQGGGSHRRRFRDRGGVVHHGDVPVHRRVDGASGNVPTVPPSYIPGTCLFIDGERTAL